MAAASRYRASARAACSPEGEPSISMSARAAMLYGSFHSAPFSNQLRAFSRSGGIYLPSRYIMPSSMTAPRSFRPAAFSNHSTALAASCGTPRPSRYLNARSPCAVRLPLSAA